MRTILKRAILPCFFVLSPGLKLIAQETVVAVTQEVKVKEISDEFPGGNAPAIDLDIQRDVNVEIVPWDETRVKVVYRYNQAWYKELSTVWISDLGFTVTQSASSQKLSVASMPERYFNTNKPPSSIQSDYIVIDEKKYHRSGRTEPQADNSSREKLTVYIPRNKKLILKLYYNGSVTIAGDLAEADITTSFGGSNFKAKSIQKLWLKAYYPRASFENIGEAEVDVMGGQLFIKKIAKLNARSRYAAVQIGSAEEVNLLLSQSDEYVIEELGTLTGAQKFGVVRINALSKNISMDESSDIVIKNILPGTELLKIKSTQVTLKLPVSNLKNYYLSVNGSGSTVLLTEDIRKGIVGTGHLGNVLSPVAFSGPGTAKFTSRVGDTNEKHTVFDISCLSCNVSFR
ncbi:MAG: hypothetical protein ABI581_06480 [Sediminibacterium sp.]